MYREQALPGAVLVRVATSHIRVGTFQFFASRRDTEALQLLTDHVIGRHFPEAADAENPALAMLEAVIARQAQLIAKWQLLGFIHGVMNTDNMLLGGETVDYGPCAFMDSFDPNTVFSSIDHGGRYAYRNQPGIAHWNLANLAQTLLPILHEDEDKAVELAQSAIDQFETLFLDAHQAGMSQKLGIDLSGEDDELLVQDLLSLLAETSADFTLAFRALADAATPNSESNKISELFEFEPSWDKWLSRWRERCKSDSRSAADRQRAMYQVNPVYIPRNHLVEEAIRAAEDNGDLKPFQDLVDRLYAPFDYDPAYARYATPPRPEQRVYQTFCGT